MTVLRSGISAHTTVLPVDAPLSSPSYPIFYDIDSETVKVTDGADTTEWQVERGVASTQQAKHAKNVRLVANASPFGGGGGGVTVEVPPAAPVAVTNIVAAGAVIAGSTATISSTIVVAADDPGAIGPRNLWLEVVFGDGNGDGGDGRLWVRNSTDDGWNSASPLSFSDATSTLVASPADVSELTLKDSSGSLLTDPTKLTLRGSKTLILDSVGVHIGATGDPALLTGSADPSSGGGVAAPVGSVYLRVSSGAGSIWSKTAAGDTAWTLISTAQFTNTSLASYTAAGNISVAAGPANSMSLSASTDLALNATNNINVTGAFQLNGGPFGRAAHVANGSTVDQLRDALIASGLMAAS